jgi:hypothetical protein
MSSSRFRHPDINRPKWNDQAVCRTRCVMSQRMCKGHQCKARASTTIRRTSNQSQSHTSEFELQPRKISGARNKTSGESMRLQWNNTGFHGPTPVKNSLSDGLIMKESTLFKKQLGWTVERLFDDDATWQFLISSNCILPLITVKTLYYK